MGKFEGLHNMIYVQMLKNNNEVNLIGGIKEGLPIENHDFCWCIEIANRQDEIKVGMIYDEETDTFSYPNFPKPEEPQAPELNDYDYDLLKLIENDLFK